LNLGLTENQGIQSPGYAIEVADGGLAIVVVEVLFRSAHHFARLLSKNSLRCLLNALIPPGAHIEFRPIAGGEEHGLLNLGVSTERGEGSFGLRRRERETFPNLDRRRQVADANDGDGAQRKKPP
jgi:hypothetical protein